MNNEKVIIVKYAKHVAKQFAEFTNYQYNGKNGANSDNEKGYWRGRADGCLAVLNDLKKQGLIEHTGLFGDTRPVEKK